MKLIVGLGNPGAKYAGTRHNVGFEVIAALFTRNSGGGDWNREAKSAHHALVGDVRVEPAGDWDEGERPDGKVLLAAPMTYMNDSGRSVRSLVDFYKLDPADVLVVCDDKDLDCGRLRMRKFGSAGGQKGLKNILDHLGTQDVARLRVGVGRPPRGVDTADYVLSPFRVSEREAVEEAVVDAAEGAERWAARGTEAAMNAVNAPKP